jgi:1-deoxy-D-xylulose-5-phosphate reductoisomerase
MKGPISYALAYPGRVENVMPPLSLAGVGELTFEEPDTKKYKSLTLTYQVLEQGGTMPCVFNAANEVAVDAFLDEKISFAGITRVVSDTLDEHRVSKGGSLEEIMYASEWARGKARDLIGKL